MKKIKVGIEGMHCSSCATNVERSIRKIPGVKEVSVSAITNKGFVECDEKVTDEDIKKAISKAGYKTVSIETT